MNIHEMTEVLRLVKKSVEAAVKEEREACAKLCEEIEMRNTLQGPADCAVAIRARGSDD